MRMRLLPSRSLARAPRCSRSASPESRGPRTEGRLHLGPTDGHRDRNLGQGLGPGPGQSSPAQLEPGARRSRQVRPVGAPPSLAALRPPPGPRPPPSFCLRPLTSILPYPLGLGLCLPTAAAPQPRSVPLGTLLAPSFRGLGSSLRSPGAGRLPLGLSERVLPPGGPPSPRTSPHLAPLLLGARGPRLHC